MKINLLNFPFIKGKALLLNGMRIFFFLFFSAAFCFNPIEGISQHTKIKFESNKTLTVDEIFEEIERQTSYRFIYPSNLFEDFSQVNVKKGEIALDSLLEKSFDRSQFTFQLDESKSIVINRNALNMLYQQQVVSGTVTDGNGVPLPAVNITVEGTSKGTTTDFDGNYEIEVEKGQKLKFTSIGFEDQTIEIGDERVVHVTMREGSALDEVVLIGYGRQSKAKVVGTVSNIDNKTLGKISSPSIDQQLAGKVPGVVINQSDGQPGASTQINIRGVGTLTAGAEPLIVVDGFPLSEGSSLNSINPNDVEDISILKDAASAAIYGSRAANGVILITTKKGKSGKATIALQSYWGIQQQSSGVKLIDAYDYAQFLTEARNWGYVSKDPLNRNASDPNSVRVNKKIDGKSIDGRELYPDYLQPYLNGEQGLVNTNWMKEAFRDAPVSNYDLSVSGGNEKTKYYTSLNFYDQKGVVRGTDLKRYSASLNLQHQFNDKIDMGVSMNPSYVNQNMADQASRSSGALALTALNAPIYSPYNDDGSLNISEQILMETREIEGVSINGTPVENLLATATEVENNKLRFRTFGNMYLNIEPVKGLNYKLSVGGDYDAFTNEYYYPSYIGAYRDAAPRSDADGSEIKENKINYIIENTLNYNFKVGLHSFDILGGHSFQKENSQFLEVIGKSFPDDNIQNIAGASSFSANKVNYTWALESYLGRIQYEFDDKYLVSAGIRTDGSSRFGENNRWGVFPSVSAGWILSAEDFFQQNNFVNFVKLSASWGRTGNNQIGNYGSRGLVTSSNYVFGNSLASGYITTSPSNLDLGWEIASSLNFGLDLSMLKSKMDMSLAYYITRTSDLLLNVPVPQQTGYSSILANNGEMENKGLEASIIGRGFNLGEVQVGFNANISTYQNKVLALGPGQDKIATGTDENFVTRVGRPIAEIFGYNIIGVYKTQEEIDNSPHLSGTLTGDYIVADTNGDGKITEEDKISKGTYNPDFTYGFGSDISYKNFTFSFTFTGVAGRTLLDGDMSSLTEAGEGFGVQTQYYFKNRYHPENNPDGFLGQPNYANFSNARKLTRSSSVVKKNNGDYFRLRDIRFAYNLPGKVLEKVGGFSAAQIYVSGNNLFTITNYRGWNPDGTSDNILTSGFNDGSNYPISRKILLGINITY